MAKTKRAGRARSESQGDAEFSAPIAPMPTNPLYPPRDYEECARLVVKAFTKHKADLPKVGLTPEQMAELLGYSEALQEDEERYARALAKAGGARVAYDDKVWRTCLKINELTRTLADDNPELAERFAFLGEFIRARLKGETKAPPSN